MMPRSPKRGEIWSANLDPTRGHEQAGERPVLIISTDTFNRGSADLIFILPITRTNCRIPFHIPIDPPEGGLTACSYILCDALRSITKERLGTHAWGTVSPQILATVEYYLRVLLEL